MCFAIPLKVLSVDGNNATVEGNRKILVSEDIMPKKGEYLRVIGNIAESKLSRKEGKKIRDIINNLNNRF